MAVSTGFNAKIELVTGGTCTITNDTYSTAPTGTAAVVGYIDSYTINSSLELIDTTAFGDKVRKNVPGFPGYTMSMSGSYDFADTQQKAIWDEMNKTTTRVPMLFKVTENKAITWVKGYLTGAAQGSSVGGKSTFSADLSLVLIPRTCSLP
jgi:hypothetical protein